MNWSATKTTVDFSFLYYMIWCSQFIGSSDWVFKIFNAVYLPRQNKEELDIIYDAKLLNNINVDV